MEQGYQSEDLQKGTGMTEEFYGDSWDLSEVLAERAQPTDEVVIYLNEVASFAKSKLLKSLKGLKGEALDVVNAEIEELEKDLERTKYVVHVKGVPSRMREDIASKAMHAFPIKPGVFGQDDPENAKQRMIRENELVWHAQIFDVVNPRGAHKRDWTFEEMQNFANSLPTAAQKAIDSKINEVTKASEEFTVGSKDQNFS